MIEHITKLNGQVITDIEVRTDDDTCGDRGGHMGYEIVITTDGGHVVIGGCHDLGPEEVDDAQA